MTRRGREKTGKYRYLSVLTRTREWGISSHRADNEVTQWPEERGGKVHGRRTAETDPEGERS